MTAAQPFMNGILPLLADGVFEAASLVKKMKDAPEEIQEFADDVNILGGVLVQFEETLQIVFPDGSEPKNQGRRDYKTAESIVLKLEKTIHKMTDHDNFISVLTKDTGFLKQLLARFRWLQGRSSMAAAQQTIHMLSSTASLFLNSLICKILYASISDKDKNEEEVPVLLSSKLKATITACEREKRRVKLVSERLDSINETVLMQTRLDLDDIRDLQRIGKTAARKATKTIRQAQKYTKDPPSQPKPGGSSSTYSYTYFIPSPSASSVHPTPTQQERAHERRSAAPRPLQTQDRREARAAQRTRAQATPTSRSRRRVPAWPSPAGASPPSLSSGFDSPEEPSPGASSSTAERAFFVVQPSDASQSSVENPAPEGSKRRQAIYGSRVRDDGTSLTVEESNWPEGIFKDNGLSRAAAASAEGIASTHGKRVGKTKRPQTLRKRSSTVSRDSSNHEPQTNTRRFGEEFKPLPPFTEDDHEERYRRHKRGK